jgi:hypothetical protein
MTITFDPETYKRTTRQQWQDAAEAWHRWGPTIEDWLGDATARMLDAAGVGPGSRVLDVRPEPAARASSRPAAWDPEAGWWPPTSRQRSWNTRRRLPPTQD